MVLQTNIIDKVLSDLQSGTTQMDIGEISTVTATSNALDVVHATSVLDSEILGNVITFNGRLDETQANGETVNAIAVKVDDIPIDINKHTDIQKDEGIIIDYGARILFFIE